MIEKILDLIIVFIALVLVVLVVMAIWGFSSPKLSIQIILTGIIVVWLLTVFQKNIK
jgi:hypothetical protein